MSFGTMARLVMSAIVVASLITPSVQHAYLAYPESRNYQAFLIPPDGYKYYCPHCGQGGGSGHTPSMGCQVPATFQHPQCGDPFQDVQNNPSFVPFTDTNPYIYPNLGGRFYRTTNMTQGQTFRARVYVSTNHGGRMSLAICPLPRDQVTPECFARPENRLRRVNANPLYNNKWYWYLRADHGPNTPSEEDFKLPDGASCENGCVMQWWWLGYQSCYMPCEDSSVDVPGECATNPTNPPVSQCSNILGTEQFYNCADIVIRSEGGSGSSTPPPPPLLPPPGKVSPQPGSSSSPPPPFTPSPSPTTVTLPPPPVIDTSPPLTVAAPPPPSSGSCATDDWRCATCMTNAAINTASSGLVSSCYTCSISTSNQPSACAQCMLSSTIPDVIQGCFSCAMRGVEVWTGCNQYCAQHAFNGPQMNSCSNCIAAPGINIWGCQNCLQMAKGDMTKSDQCMTCVKAGVDGWTCGQCATKSTLAAVTTCYSCLATTSPSNQWSCIVA